mmetsp:Transcript_8948/g.23455  ORF Transcript_8948/g.23455 Transcript_8948/m.23455 type:complete len:202 (-) Transcript_8948:127-732(-)
MGREKREGVECARGGCWCAGGCAAGEDREGARKWGAGAGVECCRPRAERGVPPPAPRERGGGVVKAAVADGGGVRAASGGGTRRWPSALASVWKREGAEEPERGVVAKAEDFGTGESPRPTAPAKTRSAPVSTCPADPSWEKEELPLWVTRVIPSAEARIRSRLALSAAKPPGTGPSLLMWSPCDKGDGGWGFLAVARGDE